MFLKRQSKINIIIEWFFYIFIFLLPLQTRYIINAGYLNGPWEYGTYSLYVIDIILIILFLLSLFYKNKIHIKKNATFYFLLSTFLLITFFSLYWARNQELGFYYWLRLLGVIMFIYLISKIKIDLKKLSWAIIFAGFLQSLLAITQFLSQKIIACKWLGMAAQTPATLGAQVIEGPTGRWLRAYGSLPHPNILGGFLVICLLLIIFVYLKEKNKINIIIQLICLVFISFGLFFTFSRAAAIGLFIALIFLSLFIFWKQKKYKINFIKIIIFLSFILITLTAVYPSLVINRFNQINRLEKKSIHERASLQQQSLILIKNYWPTGVGYGNYTKAVHDLIDEDMKSYQNQPVHNIYLLILSEIGLFGLLTMLLIIVNSILKINFKKINSVFIVSLLIAIITISFFDHYFMTLNFGMLLFFLPIALLNK